MSGDGELRTAPNYIAYEAQTEIRKCVLFPSRNTQSIEGGRLQRRLQSTRLHGPFFVAIQF